MERLNFSLVMLLVIFTSYMIPLQYSAAKEIPESLFPDGHRGWASSLSGGALKSDVWISQNGVKDAHELFRQVDLDGKVVEFYDSQRPDARTADIKRISKLDVLISSDIALAMLTPDERIAVKGAVRNGMGLVVVGFGDKLSDNESFWESEERVDALSTESKLAGDILHDDVGDWKTYRLQNGRIALFDGHRRPATQELNPHEHIEGIEPSLIYEYRLVPLIRAILWSGKYESEQTITGVQRPTLNEPDSREIPPQLPAEFTQYMLDGRAKTITQTVSLDFDGPATRNYDILIESLQPYRKLSWSYLMKDAVSKGDTKTVLHVPTGKGENWIDLTVLRGEAIVDWISYRVSLDEWPKLNGVEFSKKYVKVNDSLEISFTVKGNSHTPTPTRVFIVLSDTHDRVLKEQRVEIGEEGGDVKTILNWTDALTKSMHVELFLVEDKFRELTEWSKRYASYASTKLNVNTPSKIGMQWTVDGGNFNEPWQESLNNTFDGAGVNTLSVGNLHDGGQSGISANLAGSTILAINSDCLTAPEGLEDSYEAIQSWVRSTLGQGLENVHLQWPHTYRVIPCPSESCRAFMRNAVRTYYPHLDELNARWGSYFTSWPEVAIPEASSSSIADVRRVGESIELEAFRQVRKQVSDISRISNIGVVDLNEFLENERRNALAWLPELSLIAIDPDPLLIEKVRSYRSPNSVAELHITEESSFDSRNLVWNALFHGMSTIWSSGVGDGKSNELGDALRDMRNGLDALILNSTVLPVEIAIYENAFSSYTSTMRQRKNRQAVQLGVSKVLEGLGLGYRFVAYAELMQTGLSKYKIVILPAVTALSDEEVAMLKAFSADGGVLILDGVAGQVDEHGVARRGLAFNSAQLDTITFENGGAMDRFDALAEKLMIRRLYKELKDENGQPAQTEWFQYQYGKATIIGVLSSSVKKSRSPFLKLTDEVVVYDVLTGNSLRPSRVRASLNDAGAGILAVLPYRVSRIILNTPDIVGAGSRMEYSLQVKTFDELPGDHLLHATVRDRKGESLRHYEAIIECKNGLGQAYVPLAFNERPGTYTLEVRDIMTGITTRNPFEVTGH